MKVFADIPTTYRATAMIEHVLARTDEIGYPVVLSIPIPHIEIFADRLRVWRDHISWGPENDLIKRHLLASDGYDHVVRVTGDTPFLDPWAARCTIDQHLRGHHDLTIDEAEGRGVQVYRRELLERMDAMPLTSYEREHLDVWPLSKGDDLDIHEMKFSVDTPDELETARRRATL